MRHAFAVVPPHVERQDLRKRERLRDLAPHDGPRHWPRLDEPQREVGRGLGGPEAAVGQHHPQRRGVSGARESGVEVAEVVPDERLHVGVDHRGAGALVFLDLRQHLRGGGHRELGGELSQEPRRLPFVLGVDVRVQEGDRDRAHPLRPHERDGGLDLLRRDRAKDVAVAVGALVDGDPQMPRDQRSRRIGPELVGRHPDVAAKLEHVAEAAGREQRGARALALDDRVRDQGGGVCDAARAGHVLRVDGAECPQAFENGDRGVGRGRQALLDVDGAGALVVQDEIGERTPDVAAQPIRHPRLAHRSLPDVDRFSLRRAADPPVRGRIFDVLESPIPDRTPVRILPAQTRPQLVRRLVVDRLRRGAFSQVAECIGQSIQLGENVVPRQ